MSTFEELWEQEHGDAPKFDARAAMHQCWIDTSKPLGPQPMLLSYGMDWEQNPICVLGEGDISVISGFAKTKKTFFKTMLISSYISGDEMDPGKPFRTHRTGNEIILDIDTEQSAFHAQRAAKRVEYIAGKYEGYKPMGLKRYTAKERMAIIEAAVDTYKDRIGLICIDGFVDLAEDFNDQVEAREISEKLMRWATDYKCHITGVLHLNPGSNKMIGHIGSAIIRKVGTAFTVQKDDEDKNASWVTHSLARDMEIDRFKFEIINGIPKKADEVSINF